LLALAPGDRLVKHSSQSEVHYEFSAADNRIQHKGQYQIEILTQDKPRVNPFNQAVVDMHNVFAGNGRLNNDLGVKLRSIAPIYFLQLPIC